MVGATVVATGTVGAAVAAIAAGTVGAAVAAGTVGAAVAACTVGAAVAAGKVGDAVVTGATVGDTVVLVGCSLGRILFGRKPSGKGPLTRLVLMPGRATDPYP